jgi:hypothetical protein
VLSEGDTMRLITHSTKPEAQEFERKVFEEVLPSIRKHGMYIAGRRDLSPAEASKILELAFGPERLDPLNLEHCIILLRELHKNMGSREANACFKRIIGYEPPRRDLSLVPRAPGGRA